MKNANIRVVEELSLLLKQMERIRESFRLQKEEALAESDLKELHNLRELSRTKYQPKLRDIFRYVRKLSCTIKLDEPGREEAEDLLINAENVFRELQAHLISVPNRLIRVFKSGGINPNLNSNLESDSSQQD
ncbi:MAG: hypothetical protein KAW14_05175 [Candidatus Aegiribacteria sp.]|jgi:uncharacterized protein YnzC (UPF0291/DUF896 family)|nr:hypothetical protein [Candidatus Aegiribacteria sp.]